MNSMALQIYSFFMRNEIEFTRYYHPMYVNRTQWKSVLKKSKLEAVLPVYDVFYQKHTGLYFLSMCSEDIASPSGAVSPSNDNALVSATNEEMEEFCKITHCQMHTLSPLGLLFDHHHQCRLQIDSTLYDAKTWCLSPCSDESSVIISPDVFQHQFLPALSANVLI